VHPQGTEKAALFTGITSWLKAAASTGGTPSLRREYAAAPLVIHDQLMIPENQAVPVIRDEETFVLVSHEARLIILAVRDQQENSSQFSGCICGTDR